MTPTITLNFHLLKGLPEVTTWSAGTIYALLLGMPTSVLSISWFQFFRNRRGRPKPDGFGAALALTALSLSYAIFLFALGGKWLAGTNRKFKTIGINVAVSAVIFLLLVWKKNPLSVWLSLAAIIMALVWFDAGAVNSVV